MAEICIYAEKEGKLGFFAPEYGDYVKAMEQATLAVIEEYGGRYDLVVRKRDVVSGRVYRSERFPAAIQDYVTHVYLEDTAVEELAID